MTARGPQTLTVAERRQVSLRRLAATGLPAAAVPPGVDPTAAMTSLVSDRLALQAQDLASGLWSVGVRLDVTADQVRTAMVQRALTRTWPMRGTLHLMATRDVRWMCGLLAGRSLAAMRRRHTELGLTDEVVGQARRVIVGAASSGEPLRRDAAYDALSAAGIDPGGQRGIHLLGRLSQEAVLCQGPPEGTQPTFVLLDAWETDPWTPGREEAMATVAERYVRHHGPVTDKDLAGWTGQTLGFVREAVALAGDRIVREQRAGLEHLVHVDAPIPDTTPAPTPDTTPTTRVHLLPGFDEYLLGYKDRSAMLTADQEAVVVPGGNGVFLPTLVVDGLVAGTWARRVTATAVDVTVTAWRPLPAARRREAERAAEAYGRFLGLEARSHWVDR